MAEVHSLDKQEYMKNCSQLADHFTNRMLDRYRKVDEVHLIFYHYDVTSSLKTATHDRKQGSQPVVSSHITHSTHIAKLPMKRLLSDNKIKIEPSCYQAAEQRSRV